MAETPPEPQAGEREQSDGHIPPEEGDQEAYDRVVLAAGDVIYGDAHDQVMQMLTNGASDPAGTLASTALMIFMQLDEASGGTIPEGIFLKPLGEIVEMLGGLAQVAGVFEVDDAVLNQAAQMALQQVASEYDIPPEIIKEFIDEIDVSERDAMVSAQSQYAGVQQGASADQPSQPNPEATPAAPPAAGGGLIANRQGA